MHESGHIDSNQPPDLLNARSTGRRETAGSPSRRGFLVRAAAVGTLAFASFHDDAVSRVLAAGRGVGGESPGEAADNEGYWGQIQRAFAVDRSLINLNNGGCNPSPRYAMDAQRRHLDFANQIPSRHLWRVQDPQVELVRQRLARLFGCDAEEIAITRNASESLEIILYGLDLKPGDEVLTTEQDYPRMINTLKQRELREGIVLKTFAFPNPPPTIEYLAEQFEKNITSRTKAVLMSHMTTLTGQIFPVKLVCQLARSRGITSIVDGAHSFAHIVFKRDDIGCDFFGTSLHKWLHAPIGTGLLYVRRERIADHWPLMAAPEPKADDIRKFEEIGTHPDAARLAVAEAITLYEGIGPARKEARLRFLRDRFAKRLAADDRTTLYTSLDPAQSCGMATLGFDGLDPGELAGHLWKKHKIYVTTIKFEAINGIRVSPNIYTTLSEIDMFCEAVEDVLKNGLPG